MLGDNVIRDVAMVQVAGHVCDLKAALCKVLQTIVKQLVVICLESDLSADGKNLYVLSELCGMSEAAFVMLASGPGVTEVDVDSGYSIRRPDNLSNFINVIGSEGNVLALSVVFFKETDDVASANTQHITLDVNSNKVCVRILQGLVSNKGTFATTYLKLDRVAAPEKILPSALIFCRVLYKELAGIKLRLSPLFFTDSHLITEKHNILIIYIPNQ